MSENNGETQSEFFTSSSSYARNANLFYATDLYSDMSVEEIRSIIKDPMGNNAELRALSAMAYNANGIVTNTIDYMCALPTMDRIVIPYAEDKKKDSVKKQAESFLDLIRDSELGRDCLFNALIDGVAFYYIETAKRPSRKKYMDDFEAGSISEINAITNASYISLSPDYTKIVGIMNSSYVLAFNLNYFTEGGSETADSKLRKYPKEIRDAYTHYDTNKTGKNWVVLDNTRTIAVKFRAKKSEPWGRPLVLAALQDILYSDYFTDTKRTVLDEVNNRIYYQTFPEGEKKGLSTLSRKQQEEQHIAVRQGITTKNNRGGTSFFSVAAGTKIESLDTDIDLLDAKNEANLQSNVSTSMGFAGSLLSGSGESSYSAQESNLRLVTSEIYQIIELFTYELNKVLNAHLGSGHTVVKVYYLPITHANRDTFVEFAKELYLEGRGSLLMWAAAAGIRPDAFIAIMDYELSLDLDNKYPVHKTSFTQSASGDAGGRPQKKQSTNPNTVASKTNNTNLQPKPGA